MICKKISVTSSLLLILAISGCAKEKQPVVQTKTRTTYTTTTNKTMQDVSELPEIEEMVEEVDIESITAE